MPGFNGNFGLVKLAFSAFSRKMGVSGSLGHAPSCPKKESGGKERLVVITLPACYEMVVPTLVFF